MRGGYASASTDTGHEASDSTWLHDRQRRTVAQEYLQRQTIENKKNMENKDADAQARRLPVGTVPVLVPAIAIGAETPCKRGELGLHLRLGLPMGFQASIIAIGALVQVAPPLAGNASDRPNQVILGLAGFALALTAVNMFGGFAVTRRMLAMFRK